MMKTARVAAALSCLLFLSSCGILKGASPLPSAGPADSATPGYRFEAYATVVPGGGIPAAVDRVSPAVVGLAVTETRPAAQGGETVEGLGSGVFVDARGYILTNNHVAGAAAQIEVVTADGSKRPGNLIWSDRALDLAIVKAEGGPYPVAELGTSQDLRVGDTVVTVGTPLTLNFQHTVTSGIVSALRRTLKVSTDDGLSFMEELIQTDAPINPGNSGGPLCDMGGRVVGINTLKVVEAEGIGFAIPIEVARPIVERVAREGTYTTPYLGLFAIDAEIARYYGEASVSSGILVIEVDPHGPASAAGIRKNDLVSQMDGQPVDTLLKMREILYAHRPGDSITVNWERDGKAGQATVKLETKPVT
jgi:S1-C subfamily serine protease